MLDFLFSYIAPHYCCSCGEIGAPLCDNCKYDIGNENSCLCLHCGNNGNDNDTCSLCCLPYRRSWCVGERSGALERLVDDYKFRNARSIYKPLGDLLDARLPILPAETIVVPIPTVAAHVRQRGYDHTLLVARRLARCRGLKLATPLRRKTTTKQRDADRKTRLAQAKAAFMVNKALRGDAPYLLIDDVVTTGATLEYATRSLQAAGAREVWVAAIAKQMLD